MAALRGRKVLFINTDGIAVLNSDLWLGTVTTTGSSTITVTFQASETYLWNDLTAQEYSSSAGASTRWTADTFASASNDGSSASVDFPSLTASGSGELYVGYGAVYPGVGVAGSTPGVTYHVTSENDLYVYDTDVSGTIAPTATQSPAGESVTTGALLTATSAPLSSISSVGSLQESSGLSQSTLSVDPQHVGDALVLAVAAYGGNGVTVSSVSGGGATWQKLTNTNDSAADMDSELWLGTVTTSGNSSITVSYGGSYGGGLDGTRRPGVLQQRRSLHELGARHLGRERQ